MNSMVEIWDLFDENRRPTGETMTRGGKAPEGRYYQATHVWIRDDQGRFLISQRHPNKPTYPLYWEATGGAVIAGEDPLTGAMREVEEELGLALPAARFVLLKSERREAQSDFLDTWLVHWNGEISELKLQESEVIDAKWVTWEELCALDEIEGRLAENREDYHRLFAGVPHAPVAICPMEMRDYDAIYGLWARIPGMGVNDHDDSPEGIARFLERNPGCCFVAKSGNGVIGASLAGHDGRRGHLYHTAVAPEVQGQGIGRALVEASVQALRKAGVGKIGIQVFADNESGNRFWEKYGFVARPDVTYHSYRMVEMKEIHTK